MKLFNMIWDTCVMVISIITMLYIVYVATAVENPTNAQLADCIFSATCVILMRMNSLSYSKSNNE